MKFDKENLGSNTMSGSFKIPKQSENGGGKSLKEN